jgi:hypothetical protein
VAPRSWTASLNQHNLNSGEDCSGLGVHFTFEETRLQVRLRGFLADTLRTTSFNRSYLAERIGGTPADMGWESQAVQLVPRALLGQYFTHPNDQPLLQALQAHSG